MCRCETCESLILINNTSAELTGKHTSWHHHVSSRVCRVPSKSVTAHYGTNMVSCQHLDLMFSLIWNQQSWLAEYETLLAKLRRLNKISKLDDKPAENWFCKHFPSDHDRCISLNIWRTKTTLISFESVSSFQLYKTHNVFHICSDCVIILTLFG